MVGLRRVLFGAIATALAASSCTSGGGDGAIEPPPPRATTVEPVTATNQQAHVGHDVTTPPGVLVRDQRNNALAGVTVRFEAFFGDGSVSPSEIVTGSNGEAHLTRWTLGPLTGQNSVRASVTGLAPVTFNATGVRVATNVVAASSTNQTAVAGANVAEPPSVRVTDLNGNPMNGISVTFAVASGGGSVTTTPPVTNADGVASADFWTLGNAPGVNTVTATVANVGQVVFTATGIAAPTTMTAQSPVQQTARVSTAVPVAPAVLVVDQVGTPMAGVNVAFTVTTGGGSVTPANVVTSSDGIAQLTSWVLGPAAGTNTVNATVSGLTPVTFTAAGIACPAPADIALGSTVNGNLGSSGCTATDGAFVELYQFTLAATTAVRIAQSSGAIDSYLHLLKASGDVVAENDDAQAGGTLDAELFALLAPGTYIVAASSVSAGESGAFTLTVQATAESITDCTLYFATRNVTSGQSLSATDCAVVDFRSDLLVVYLQANQQVTISMSSGAVDSYIALYRDAFGEEPTLVAENDDKSAGTQDAEVVYTPARSGYYLIELSSAVPGQTGAYTLSIQ